MRPHHPRCGCPWCQEERESHARIRRPVDDWPIPPAPRRQRGSMFAAVAGIVFGSWCGVAAVTMVLWMMIR
jgi:hypothetical protein